MRMYDVIMMHPTYKKEVLTEFGFGEVSPLEVERWFRETYPMVYKQVKVNLAYFNKAVGGRTNLIPFKVEATTQQERSAILDSVMTYVDDIASTKEYE